jgi:hypothetical protein
VLGLGPSEPIARTDDDRLGRFVEQSELSQERSGCERVLSTDRIEQRNPRVAEIESSDVGCIDVQFFRDREEHGQGWEAFASLDPREVCLGDLTRPSDRFLGELRSIPKLANARSDSSGKCRTTGPRRHGATVLSWAKMALPSRQLRRIVNGCTNRSDVERPTVTKAAFDHEGSHESRTNPSDSSFRRRLLVRVAQPASQGHHGC